MKRKTYPAILGALLLSGTAVVPASASEQGFYIGPHAGYYVFDNDRNNGHDSNNNADDASFLGIGMGYQFNRNFALEASYSRLMSEVRDSMFDRDVKFQNEGDDADIDMYRLDGIFNIDLNSSWSPYLVMGYAKIEQDPQFGQNDDMMNMGFGIKRKLTQNLSLRGDIRGFHNFDNEDTDYGVQVGLLYQFGAATPPPPAQIPAAVIATPVDPCTLDNDDDGVNNCEDKCPGTPPGNWKMEVTGCRILKEPKEIRLEVLFDTNKAVVKKDYFYEIQQVADFMQKYPSVRTQIQGHTDSRGNDKHNKKLSQRRADAVRQVLINRFNVSPSRLSAVGYGEESLVVVQERSSADFLQNRRVIAYIKTVVEEVEGI
ncbi:MAG: OmpA family protein [Thiomargarita sp.]|nr:OmpA family protein [Thiomargarita sp.]